MSKFQIRRKLWLLPILTASFCILSFIITYIVAMSLNHVEAVFPYISYTGIKTPERGIFGQLLNMGAFLLGLNTYFKYLRLCHIKCIPQKVNLAGVILGFISAFGMSMVANFETRVMRAPHYVGALLGFGVAVVYCWLQTVLSWKRRFDPLARSRFTFLYQLVVTTLLTLFTVIFIVSKIVFKNYVKEDEKADELKLIPGKVRTAYLISTTSEWILVICLMLYLLSYVPDFRNVEFRHADIVPITSDIQDFTDAGEILERVPNGKMDSTECSPLQIPNTSHVSLTVVAEDDKINAQL